MPSKLKTDISKPKLNHITTADLWHSISWLVDLRILTCGVKSGKLVKQD